MLSTENAATVLGTLVSCLGIWWVFVLYRDYCVDRFREQVFSLRGELFDEAAAGMIDFNHPAYGMLRSTMNGFIRFGHRLGFFEIALSAIFFGKDLGSFEKRWKKATKGLDADVQARLDAYLASLNNHMVSHIVWSSPVFLVTIIFPIFLVLFANRFLALLGQTLKPAFESIDTAALVCGES